MCWLYGSLDKDYFNNFDNKYQRKIKNENYEVLAFEENN